MTLADDLVNGEELGDPRRAQCEFLRGRWWRVLTALTLHADLPHPVMDALLGALGYPAARLRAGAVHHLVLLPPARGSHRHRCAAAAATYLLGASTAVFTALGLILVLGAPPHARLDAVDAQCLAAPARGSCVLPHRHRRRPRHPRPPRGLRRRRGARRTLRAAADAAARACTPGLNGPRAWRRLLALPALAWALALM